MTEIWMGCTSLACERADERRQLAGDRQFGDTLPIWLGSSRFANMDKRVA